MSFSVNKIWIPLLCIFFFFFFILYPLFIDSFPLIEGMDNASSYKEYDTSDSKDALILAQQNAGNIAYLKEKLDDLESLNATVMDNCGNIVALNQQVNAIIQQQTAPLNTINGGQPIQISDGGGLSDNSTSTMPYSSGLSSGLSSTTTTPSSTTSTPSSTTSTPSSSLSSSIMPTISTPSISTS
jgi:hypothetical protein